MNILLILSQLEVTGAEIYAVRLADALIARGHTVTIVSDTLRCRTDARYVPMDLNNRSIPNRLRHVRLLSKLIRREKIDVVHANSRASSWVGALAARLCGVPMTVTVHGRQPTHLSRRLTRAFGSRTMAVCENVRTHLIQDLGVPPGNIELVRNGIRPLPIPAMPNKGNERVISIIGRLSGPKGEVAYTLVKDVLPSLPSFNTMRVIVAGGNEVPERFHGLPGTIELLGYVENVGEVMARSDLVIGAGQVAMQALVGNKPVVAVGEACTVGLVTPENFDEALTSNFGDIASPELHDWDRIRRDVAQALEGYSPDPSLKARAVVEFEHARMVDHVLAVYRRVIGWHRRRDVPVLTYHRVVTEETPRGRHGIFVTAESFEWQLRYFRRKGIRTITFKDLLDLPESEHHSGRYVILTFDDGYRDNYEILFPILKRYNATAVIFLVTGRTENVWDRDEEGEPVLELLTEEQVAEMSAYGIEFGAHTATHPRLTTIAAEQARCEIAGSNERVRSLTGRAPITFCYPYGAMDERIKEMVRVDGFQLGIASNSGPVAMMADLFELRRIQIFPHTGKAGFRRKVSGRYLYRKFGSAEGG